MSGGWYCRNCGAIYRSLGDGIITCQRCGHLGLRGYDGNRPKRVTCSVCIGWTGWDDGVNDDLARHQQRDHDGHVLRAALQTESEQR